MSQYNTYKLINNHIEDFSLLKDEKNKIFWIYKTTRYKLNNQKNHTFSTIPIINKDLIINKVININFIKIIKKSDNIIENEKTLIKGNISIGNNKSFFNDIKKDKEITNNKYNNKFNNKFNMNKRFYSKNSLKKAVNNNVLIKPIMIEDNHLYNNNTKKKKESPKKMEDKYKNNYLYCNFYNNNSTNSFSFNNTSNFYPIFPSENQFKCKNTNENDVNENTLKFPKFYYFGNYNNNFMKSCTNQKNELEKSKFNSEFIKNLNNITNKFKTEKSILIEEQLNSSFGNSNTQKSNINNKKHKNILNNTNKSKGRKAKDSQNLNIESKHTKYSTDNMMRKIKNKVIESSRLLINKVLNDEINNNKNIKFTLSHKEFRKIQGSFSQELNIKYNFWFYQIKIKDIFCLEISNKYTAIEKSSNKELIEYLFLPLNNNNYIKTKNLLNMPFHQFYHDIFLGQDENWKKYYGIKDSENKYQIQHLLKNLEEEEQGVINDKNKKYINDINELAHHYEEFFLEKKPRKVDYDKKKNKFIKVFMNNSLNDKYLQLCEEVKQLKNFYENKNLLKQKNNQFMFTNQKSEETLDNSLIKKNDYLNLDKIKSEKNQIKHNENLNFNEFTNKNELKIIDSVINKPNISLDEKDENNNNKDINEKINNKYLENQNTTKINNKKIIFCNKKIKSNKIEYFVCIKNVQK